ncbi:MAG: hypothetical protein GY765_03640, partial [bacterium]|nr:hypothetical protein [bacterium]
YSIENGLVNNTATYVGEDTAGNIWIGTENGLSIIKNGRIKSYTTKDGLADNKCNFVLEDFRGHMWVGTDNGLSCFDGESFKTYNHKKNGLIANIWYCGMTDRNGRLWFGSPHGINAFTPPIKTNTTPPPVHITSVKVLGTEIPLTQHRRFDHFRNNFKFSFAGICLT